MNTVTEPGPTDARDGVHRADRREPLPGVPRHLADLSPPEQVAAVEALGLPAFRARQLARHYFVRLTCSPADMTDIPRPVRQVLADELLPTLLTQARRTTTDRDRTVKTAWRLADGALVESVLMRWPRRATVCVSTQVGCGLACTFCATGQRGLTRNLTTAEIVEQVRVAARALDVGAVPGGPGRLSHVVFMGMGEPLANYARTLAAVRTIVSPDGFAMAARHVTVSTVGLVPQIDRLADEGLPVTLAVSLHAPDDELRSELVPVNTRWDVDQVLDAG
ncbi:MAG: radical SAM protein, partial [Micrococcales bacterium]|nr:radical SAM protein [Micrococcales bacterium]